MNGRAQAKKADPGRVTDTNHLASLAQKDSVAQPMMTIGEVAEKIKISVRKLIYETQSGALPFHKFGRATRFSVDDVNAYIADRRINGRPRNR